MFFCSGAEAIKTLLLARLNPPDTAPDRRESRSGTLDILRVPVILHQRCLI